MFQTKVKIDFEITSKIFTESLINNTVMFAPKNRTTYVLNFLFKITLFTRYLGIPFKILSYILYIYIYVHICTILPFAII